MRFVAAALLLLALAQTAHANSSYVVVGRLAVTPEGQPAASEVASLVALLGTADPPIAVARAREGTIESPSGVRRYIGLTIPAVELERVMALGLTLAPEEFTRPKRPGH